MVGWTFTFTFFSLFFWIFYNIEGVCIRVEVVFDVLKHNWYLFFPSKYVYVLPFIDSSGEVQVFKIDCYFSRMELGALYDCDCVNITLCVCVCVQVKARIGLGMWGWREELRKWGKKNWEYCFPTLFSFPLKERFGNLKWLLYEL